VREREES
jgi:hypothetical protein